MKKILVVSEEYSTRYFDVSTDELLHKACINILTERLEDGWYDADEPTDWKFIEQAKLLLKGKVKNYKSGYNLLRTRSDYEYEEVSIEEIEEVR